MSAKKLVKEQDTKERTIITPKFRPPALKCCIGKMKPGHHTKMSMMMRSHQ